MKKLLISLLTLIIAAFIATWCLNGIAMKNNTNQFGESGRAFYGSINECINKAYTVGQPQSDKDFRPFLSEKLNLLEFPEVVNIHVAENNGSGDFSWFYFSSDMDKDFREEYCARNGYDITRLDFERYKDYVHPYCVAENFIRRVRVPHSIEGYWQLFLLNSASYVLPKFWHACYDCRDYIFSYEDLKSIEGWSRKPIGLNPAVLFATYDILPSVELTEYGAIVNYCYWTNWGGLIRETVRFEASCGKVSRQEVARKRTLFYYDCGILF